MARQNRTFTIGASPIRLFDGATAAAATDAFPPQYVVNLSIQMLHGGTGLGYVSLGIPLGITPDVTVSGQLTSEIAPATTTAPGGFFYQNQTSFGSPLSGTADITRAWLHGSSPGDKVVVSWESNP